MNLHKGSVCSLVLTVCALAAAFAPGTASLAQEQAKPGDKLTRLRNERLAVAREIAKHVAEAFKNGTITIDEVLEANRMVLAAELAVCDSNKARIAVLEKQVGEAKKREDIAFQRAKTGQAPERAALKARADSLQVEIALEQARTAPVGQAPDTSVDAVALAQSQVAVKQAAVKVADVQRKTAVARLSVTKGELAETQAWERFREKQLKRMQDLFSTGTIVERLVDEVRARWEAAKAKRTFAEGKILECESQVALEQARVEMAQAEADHAKLRLKQLQAPKAESSRQQIFWIDPATGNQYFVGASH